MKNFIFILIGIVILFLIYTFPQAQQFWYTCKNHAKECDSSYHYTVFNIILHVGISINSIINTVILCAKENNKIVLKKIEEKKKKDLEDSIKRKELGINKWD